MVPLLFPISSPDLVDLGQFTEHEQGLCSSQGEDQVFMHRGSLAFGDPVERKFWHKLYEV